jgi:hypothetical protein
MIELLSWNLIGITVENHKILVKYSVFQRRSEPGISRSRAYRYNVTPTSSSGKAYFFVRNTLRSVLLTRITRISYINEILLLIFIGVKLGIYTGSSMMYSDLVEESSIYIKM